MVKCVALWTHIEASQFWPKIKQSQVVLLIFSHLYLLTRSVVDRHNFAHFGQMCCFVDPRRPVIFGQMASLCHTFHLVDSHLRSCCHRKLYLGNPGTYRFVSFNQVYINVRWVVEFLTQGTKLALEHTGLFLLYQCLVGCGLVNFLTRGYKLRIGACFAICIVAPFKKMRFQILKSDCT